MRYEIIIRVAENDPMAEEARSRFIKMAETRDPFVADNIRDHYAGCGWVKGVSIIDTENEEFVASAMQSTIDSIGE